MSKNVYQCIAAVQASIAVNGIQKLKKNKEQSYNFRGIDDVYNALAGFLSENGLVVIPRVIEREQVERKTQKGYPLFYTTLKVEYDFISSHDGSKHTACAYGEAMDTADKSTNKAMSAAYKYAMFQTFCIPTEAQDADATTHEVAPKEVPAPMSAEDVADESAKVTERLAFIQNANELRALYKTLPKEVQSAVLPAFTARVNVLDGAKTNE